MNSNFTNEKKVEHSPLKQEADWQKLVHKVLASRKLILKICSIGAVVGIFMVLGTPCEYTASTLVAHESTRRGSSLGISDLAGVGINSSTTTKDAIYPSLYSTITNSTPFLISLFDVRVRERQDSTTMSLAQYMKERQKTPWWNVVTSAPFRLVNHAISLFQEKPNVEKRKAKIDIFQLTSEEAGIAGAIASRIVIEIDKKKRAITLFVTMQDPQVAATVTDTVRTHLQEYVTEYRTSKARRILEYNEKLCEEAQAEYYATQENYTRYADANRNLMMLTSRAELSRLRSEMDLAFTTYNQMELQVQAAQAKVEKVTPVYALIQPAIVPLVPSKPRKMLILGGYILLSAAGGLAWVLFVKDFIRKVKEKMPTVGK